MVYNIPDCRRSFRFVKVGGARVFWFFLEKRKLGTFFFTKIFIVSICNQSMVNCPICKNPLPLFRWATSLKQAMLGGWTCGCCKSEISRKGELIKKNEKGLKEYEDNLYREEYLKEKARLQAQREHKKK